MRKKKIEKLNIHDINKNNSKDISHTINKIKENEWKYMVILVAFFMIEASSSFGSPCKN